MVVEKAWTDDKLKLPQDTRKHQSEAAAAATVVILDTALDRTIIDTILLFRHVVVSVSGSIELVSISCV